MSIRKLRGNKNYKQVIEVNIPIRLYWTETGYDGFEFGPMYGLSSYQMKLLGSVLEALDFSHASALLVDYMSKKHPLEWEALIAMINKETEVEGIPKVILEAFKEEV